MAIVINCHQLAIQIWACHLISSRNSLSIRLSSTLLSTSIELKIGYCISPSTASPQNSHSFWQERAWRGSYFEQACPEGNYENRQNHTSRSGRWMISRGFEGFSRRSTHWFSMIFGLPSRTHLPHLVSQQQRPHDKLQDIFRFRSRLISFNLPPFFSTRCHASCHHDTSETVDATCRRARWFESSLWTSTGLGTLWKSNMASWKSL